MDTIEEEKDNVKGDGEVIELVNPPTPDIDKETRRICDGWNEYSTPYGRPYYYNSETGEKSWKPPRRKVLPEDNRLKTYSLPANASSSWNKLSSQLSLPNGYQDDDSCRQSYDFLSVEEPRNVGKILRTGKLNTALLSINGQRVKKKWVTSFAVLTEFYMMFTTQSGTLKKLFKKSKTPKANRFYLPEAAINKENALSKRENVYRLSSRKLNLSRDSISTDTSKEILFQSNNSTEAETWYHALSLVINDLKSPTGKYKLSELKQENRPRSLDILSLRQNNRNSFTMSLTDSVDGFLMEDPTKNDHYRSMLKLKMKYPTPPGYIDKYDSINNLFYYINCITGEKWFSKVNDGGLLYFTNNQTGRSSWLLPSIYLDANPKTLNRMKRWTLPSKSSKVTDV